MNARKALPDVTPTIAAHVLHACDHHGGYSGGQFVTSLIAAIVYADDPNRSLLSMGYVGYVRAVRAVQQRDDGVALLQSIAADVAGGQR